ncbi:hypothetical protein [Niallia endozanthoxylica]|uniref:Uncharacterized protein n=1 Tax=Niallia endozanthoxylica TaxID=2036016 RepID=A0A5J5GWZ2_9BACI|nr:hypothetical protein [Niallia endozanthoxylica]KAA9012841.1 hypothetical protein F4V44_25110 [Niallia endozanthoxylica]
MSNQIDLNALREELKNNRDGYSNQRIVANSEGKILQGDYVSHPPEVLSEIPTETFASLPEGRPVHPKLPRNTIRTMKDGFNGYLYTINDEFGQTYTMFLYHDGTYYQVKLVYPQLNHSYNVHNCHLYPDRRLCLNQATNGGYHRLEDTYAKSVLWANGFTTYRKKGIFPF